MIRKSIAVLGFFALLPPAAGEEDANDSKAATLRWALERGEPHRVRVKAAQRFAWPGHERETRRVEVGLDLSFDVAARSETGEVVVESPLRVRRMRLDGRDLTPAVRAQQKGAVLSGVLREPNHVARGTTRDMDRLGDLRTFLRPAASWALPFLPADPVKPGATWSVPPKYLVWSLSLPTEGTPQGTVRARLEAVKDGVARIRTTFVISIAYDAVPPVLGTGEGRGRATLTGETRAWVGLDGRLRAARTSADLELENRTTDRRLEWSLKRTARRTEAPQREGREERDDG